MSSKNKKSTKTKSKTLTYSAVITLLIFTASFLPYLHDLKYFEGLDGFSGFSSFRTGIWVVCLFVWGVSGWITSFINSKGKTYRFALLVPIVMGLYQLIIYVLDSRELSVNDYSIKVGVNFFFIVLISSVYFYHKKKRYDQLD